MDEAVLPHKVLSSLVIEKLIPPYSKSSVLNDARGIARWSRFTRLLRVLGWLLRFLHNFTVPEAKQLSSAALSNAKIRLLQYVQHFEFRDEWLALRGNTPVPNTNP